LEENESMKKIIYQVDFDALKSQDLFFDSRVLNESYPNQKTGEERFVTAIEERFLTDKRAIIVYYDNGDEEEYDDILHVFKKMIIE
jgi:hypothetical protein